MWAHNRCLKNIKSIKNIFTCPSCRREIIKPHLCVKTNLDWIRNNPSNLKKIQIYTVSIMFIIFILNYLNEQKYIVITNNYILLCFIFVLLMGTFVLFITDYITKYWLYDNITNTFY